MRRTRKKRKSEPEKWLREGENKVVLVTRGGREGKAEQRVTLVVVGILGGSSTVTAAAAAIIIIN